MPANLTPQYLSAEADYRKAVTPSDQLEALRRMLREIPKHKGTDRMQADLKTKIAKLRLIVERGEATTSRGNAASSIAKQGVGRVVMIGPTRGGKTRLLQSLTRVNLPPRSESSRAEVFTTRAPQFGMMRWQDCPLQLIDLPSIGYPPAEDDLAQWVRSADLVWLVVDLGSDDFIEQTQQAIDRFRSEKTRLGVSTTLDPNEIGVKTISTVIVCNLTDCSYRAAEVTDRLESFAEFLSLSLPAVAVSAIDKSTLESALELSVKAMDIVRVYCKHPKEEHPDMEKPLFIRRGETLREVAAQIHESLVERFKGAKVWKPGQLQCQSVKPDYEPVDCDVVELIIA
jgi:ribosome-interacting GTPase 1